MSLGDSRRPNGPNSPLSVHFPRRLGYGTDQGRWLMQQVQAKDGAPKRRAARPQHAFHDESTLSAIPPTAASAPSAADVKQGAISAGVERGQMLQDPRVLMAIGGAVCFLLLIYLVSR